MKIVDTQILERFFKAKKGEKIGLQCPLCNADMVIRIGFNKFLGCSRYPKCVCKYVFRKEQKSRFANVIQEAFTEQSTYPKCVNGRYKRITHFDHDDTEGDCPFTINCKDDM